jgi:hypothetical protein
MIYLHDVVVCHSFPSHMAYRRVGDIAVVEIAIIGEYRLIDLLNICSRAVFAARHKLNCRSTATIGNLTTRFALLS